MKFTIDKRILTEAVGNLQRAVSTKTSIPALEGILIRTDVEKIILSAYDLEIGMQTELPAVISAPGAIILTARLFSKSSASRRPKTSLWKATTATPRRSPPASAASRSSA